MKKQEIQRDMKAEIGSFPNISQIARYLKCSRDYVRTNITSQIPGIADGKSKRYFVNDVAEMILQMAENNPA